MALFWKKSNITTHPDEVKDITIYSHYPDLSEGQNTSIYTQGGPDGLHALFQFPVARSPLSGQGKIKRYDFKFYVSDIDASSRSTGALAYNIYNLIDGINLTEGNINREVSDALVIGSHPSSKISHGPFITDFNNVTPDAQAVYDDVVFDMVKGRPYLTVEDAKDLAAEDMEAHGISTPERARRVVADKYTKHIEGVGVGVPVMSDNDGLAWPATYSGDRQKYFWTWDNICFGLFKDIGSKLKWTKSEQKGTSRPDVESKKLISYNNSNFSVLSTAQDVNMEGKFHMVSDIKVSTTDGVGGPAIEMVNFWRADANADGNTYASSAQPHFFTGLRSGTGTGGDSALSGADSRSQDSFFCMRLPMPVRMDSNFKKVVEENNKGLNVEGDLSLSPSAPMELVFDMKIPEMGPMYTTLDKSFGVATSSSENRRITTHRAFIMSFSNLIPEEGETFGYYLKRLVSRGDDEGHKLDAFTLFDSFSALIFVGDTDTDERTVRVYSPAQIGKRWNTNAVSITSINAVTMEITTNTAHGLSIGDPIKFYQDTLTDNMPTGLDGNTTFYVSHHVAPGGTTFAVSTAAGGALRTLAVLGGAGTIYIHRAEQENNRLDYYEGGENIGTTNPYTVMPTHMGSTGVIEGSVLGRIPTGTWLKVRMTFDVTGAIADNYQSYTNSGRADFTINTSDGEQLVSGTIPRCEFPRDNAVWPSIQGSINANGVITGTPGYPNYYSALQFDASTADKTVLENVWENPLTGPITMPGAGASTNEHNYGWTPYFTVWNTNRKVETTDGGSDGAVDNNQPNRSGGSVPAGEVDDSVQKLLIDNITIYNAEHRKAILSPTFKSSKKFSGKIISNEPTVTGYRTQIDGGEALQLSPCYINVGFKQISDFTNSSGFWLWNNYGTNGIGNTTSIMDAALSAGYSTRNEYLGDQFGIMSRHDEDADDRTLSTSAYTSEGGVTARETGVLVNNVNGYDLTSLATFTGSPSAADASRLPVDTTYNDIVPNATSGSGTGLKFDIVVGADGITTFFMNNGGKGVAVDDTFTFVDAQMGGGGGDPIVLTATAISGATDIVVDTVDATTKFKRGDLIGLADGRIVGEVRGEGTFASTAIPVKGNAQLSLLNNQPLYNIRYNQNYYQRINIGANPSSDGTATRDVVQCWTVEDDYTLTTHGGGSFVNLVVGMSITGFNVPAGTTIAKVDSITSLEMSNKATASGTTSPASALPTNTYTFGYAPIRLPRIYTANSAGNSLEHSVKGFTQKGFTKIVDGGSNSLWGFSKADSSPSYAPGLWTKREHIGASTRIVNIKETNKFQVADPTVCDIDDDEQYIIYLAYEEFKSPDLVTPKRDINWIAPVTIKKTGDWYKIVTAVVTGGATITNLEQVNIAFSDESSASNFVTRSNIGRLFICPYRYWISICVNSAAFDYYVDRADSNTQKVNDYESVNNTPTPNRNYASIVPVDSSTDVGSTFNESTYYYNTTTDKAPYFNEWSMDIPASTRTNAIELEQDFGYGAFDEEDGTGGMVKYGNLESGFNITELSKLQEVKSYKTGDAVTLYMTTADGNVDHNITISSSQNTNPWVRPELLTVYEDEVPKSPSLSLSSMEETPNSVKFTWGNQDGDLWYGLLLIDTMNIDNQYHKSIGHLPLNENIEGTPTAYNNMYMKYYNVETANTLAIAGRWLNDITGIAGYTKDFTSVHGYRDGGTANNILYDTDGNFSTKDVQVGDSVYNMTKINAGITTDISTTVSAVDSNSQLTLVSYSVFDSFQEYEVSPRFLQFGDTALLNTPTKLSGTVYITDGATTLNGVSTSFTTELTQGQEIRIVDTIVTIASITSDIALEISSAYSPTAASDTISAPGVSITRGNSNYKFQKEFSVVAHVVPNKVALTGEAQYIFKKENSIEIKRLPAGIVRAEVKYGSNTSDFVRVDSTTRLPTDGETATCIILTVDTAIKYGNVKLYINGKLEDQSGKRLALPEQGKAWKGSPTGYGIYWDNAYTYFIGAGDIYGRNSFEGRIEEVVFYERIIYPISPQDEEFIFAKPVSEVESAGSSAGNFKVYSSKLFLKDYHNIRGTTIDEVASSNQVSFKKSSFLIEG